MRARAEEGIARGLYIAVSGRRVVVLHVFVKKTQKTPRGAVALARERMKGGAGMTKLGDLKARMMEDAAFRDAYAEVDAEYALAEELIRARKAAGLTQAALARRLGTTQSAVARLEGGQVSPSVATLRKYAEATGRRLKVALV